MLKLDAFIRRRRRLVLIAWAAILLAALPFAARQSEDLSSGGFAVPGSQSDVVDRALERFPGVQQAELAAVLIPERGASAAQLRAAVDRVGAAAGPIEGVSLAPAARERAAAQAAARRDRARAADRRGRRGRRDRRRGRPARGARGGRRAAGRRRDALRRPGRAVGGDAGPDQGGPREGRDGRLPDRAADPARRLRLVRRGRAPAGARDRLRAADRRADLRPRADDGDVGLRDQHGVDDRDRRRGRLLAVHRRALPRGGARRALARGGPRGGHGDIRLGRAVLRPDRDHLARRAVDARQHGDPLDGARGDARRRGRDARRGDAAARAARPPRHRALAAVQPAPQAGVATAPASGSAGPTP